MAQLRNNKEKRSRKLKAELQKCVYLLLFSTTIFTRAMLLKQQKLFENISEMNMLEMIGSEACKC